jgi:hypothetical protein
MRKDWRRDASALPPPRDTGLLGEREADLGTGGDAALPLDRDAGFPPVREPDLPRVRDIRFPPRRDGFSPLLEFSEFAMSPSRGEG